ncbi:MAG: T9SS type A sorting domain-containing protein [Bacteroidales bacterium]
MKSLQSSSNFLQQRLGFKTGCIVRTILGIDADNYEDLYYDITEEASYDDETKDVMVYPNPADDKISVRVNADPGEHDILVSIYNINGKLVYNKNYGADTYFTINTEELKNGLYFVKVTNHHSIDESTKIMIHH